MAIKLNIQKSAESLRLTLTKLGVDLSRLRAQVVMDMDVSGSFDDEHRDGMTNDLMTRLIPWGITFDANGEIDVFTFSNGEQRVHHVGTVTPANVEGYIKREIIEKVPGYRGGTDYSYVLEANLRHFGWLPNGNQPAAPRKSGFFSRTFGGGGNQQSASAPAAVKKERSLVLFVTDGDCSDEGRVEQVLRASQGRGDEVYFLFLAYSNQGGQFKFLQKIADMFDNTGLVIIRDLPAFTSKPDDELNAELIGDELVKWLNAAPAPAVA
jgi:hypothetical protein